LILYKSWQNLTQKKGCYYENFIYNFALSLLFLIW
jgi:hypothetical protein